LSRLLDTNTLIYFFRRAGNVRARMSTFADTELKLCSINLFELEVGLKKSADPEPRRIAIEHFKQRFEMLSLDAASAVRAGQVRAELEQQGRPIGAFDYLIAGIALHHNLIVVTRNVGEFSRVPGLRVENWHD
jgi:tRNA(fMet)-specific endonuclease VapC